MKLSDAFSITKYATRFRIDEKLIKKTVKLQDKSYEVLEYLGDAVIHAVLAEYLFRRYPNADQGFLTTLRTRIEKGETLNKFSRKLQFDKYAIISRNIELSGGRDNNVNIMEDIFEAFIGALKLETNFETCQKFIINLIDCLYIYIINQFFLYYIKKFIYNPESAWRNRRFES